MEQHFCRSRDRAVVPRLVFRGNQDKNWDVAISGNRGNRGKYF
jgi:hypothetical protein